MRMLSPLSTDWSRRNMSLGRMDDVFEDFDRIVESFLRPTYTATANFQQSCDVSETEKHYLITFDMPGVKKEDIKIEVQGNKLVIAGERPSVHAERSYGRFERTFTLPVTVATDKIEAQYENGVLSVALPKSEAAKGRTIQIQSGQEGFLSKLLGSKKESSTEKDVKLS